ncbi:TetR/AcrR family transcriptional regulator (plasmid) [Streptomyces sp. NBC_01340]|uniref:TetR/AcrR family transcriptional regulator n=1 Tax=unclassified Streptomyces TaxID=2593676 RepID=UPI0022596AA2|nr:MULTISPECIES: TetR/AcrR family transcriptional regulator [unclassified Streptomyces]MCX4460203.1 TetR/AcrR family transcriptional regulator [Streptomyces sp. NBC_01719]MCX4500466.1 TetR/AcrR family transcriptional regulator [Streptomyces sp. NBC_01728]MCX4598172.1 TetR/AcrR family transcriptional regulator [Streptomyces sp. NBC_01549]WSI45502.1 TetR/AcrR family transcriptional regulator [Streptomyces sp. NBC_01340]
MTDNGGDTARSRRPLRADAQRNEDKLLEAAAAAFAREGVGASVKDIARAAGVGVGTLYRRFPSKELLIAAIYRHEVQRLCEAAPHLAATQPPLDALRTWMERFIDFMAAKEGMADVLRVVLTDDSEKLHTRALLADAIEYLLNRGSEPAMARPEIEAQDVLMALGGISLMAANEDQRDLAARLIDLLLHGILTN